MTVMLAGHLASGILRTRGLRIRSAVNVSLAQAPGPVPRQLHCIQHKLSMLVNTIETVRGCGGNLSVALQGRALLVSVREVGRLRRELRSHDLAHAPSQLTTPGDLLTSALAATTDSSAAIPAHQGDRYSLSGTLPAANFGVPTAERRAPPAPAPAAADSTAMLYGTCTLNGDWVPMASPAEASAALDPELEEQLTGAVYAPCVLSQLVFLSCWALPLCARV